MERRSFLKGAASSIPVTLLGFLHDKLAAIPDFTSGQKRRILLRSSWQIINIGDIGHTPGVLTLLEKYLPEVEVRLWPMNVQNGVEEMLNNRFPKVSIIKSSDTETIKTAFNECDFLLHGSGAFLVASNDLEKWRKETGKPYGVYGITLNENRATDDVIELLNNSAFVFFRDSFSLNFAKRKGISCPIMEFGPDGAFGVDLRNEKAAIEFLQKNNLEEGKFLCVIPRYRNTPNWKIPGRNTPFNENLNARNEAMKEHDHKPLRDAIIAIVRQTSMKVLICAEDVTQLELGKDVLYNPLPDDVKKKVVWRSTFWLPDEAISIYIRSAGLFGNEMHSPIMCIGNGIPAIVCRFAEQTSKGIMWRDIGLGDWLFDLDVEEEIKGIVPAVLALAQQPQKAKEKALRAQQIVQKYQRTSMEVLRKNLFGG
jgi:hypothetical protein